MNSDTFQKRARHLLMTLGLACAAATGANASTITSLDVSGVSVTPPTVTERTLMSGPGTVNEIYFDISVQHFGSSWGDETEINVISPDNIVFNFRGDTTFGWGVSPGVWNFSGGVSIAPVSAQGLWRFLFSDWFNDSANPDHMYLSGSIIELRGQVATVPTPGVLPLMLGGLGLLGFLRLRRKRS